MRPCGKDDVDTICETSQCVDESSVSLICIDGFKTSDDPKQATNFEDCLGSTTTKDYTHHYTFGTIACATASSKYGSYCTPKFGETLGKSLVTAVKKVAGKS